VLATGLASRAIQMVAPPIQTQIVQQTKQQLKPPPPPPPQLQKQQVEVPPPVVNINIPQQSQTHAITVVKRVVKAAPPAPVHVTPLSIRGALPPTDDYYPDASRRLGEQGTALVKLCVGDGGKVVGQPAIQRSSGSSRLDQAALRYALATSGHFSPETKNGAVVTVCTALPIKFQLTDSF
jgi:protein TonB